MPLIRVFIFFVLKGVTEFSFEELRAIKYRRKKAEDELKCLEEEKQRWKEEQAELLRKQVNCRISGVNFTNVFRARFSYERLFF